MIRLHHIDDEIPLKQCHQTVRLILNLSPNWTLLPILTLLPNFGRFHRTLQRVRLANRGRLLLRTPGPVPFGTCICSNVETILSWTCHVYGPFEFRTSLGTSIFALTKLWQNATTLSSTNTAKFNPEGIYTLWCVLGPISLWFSWFHNVIQEKNWTPFGQL